MSTNNWRKRKHELVAKLNTVLSIDEDWDFFMGDPDDDTRYYPLEFVLNSPPFIIPLSNASQSFTNYERLEFAPLHIATKDENFEKMYLSLCRITREMSAFERRFFFVVLKKMMRFAFPTVKGVCWELLSELSPELRREMCKDAFKGTFLSEHLEYLDETVIVKKDTLTALMGEKWGTLYDAYLQILGSGPAMQAAVQRQ